jgi:aldehyde dehydrogenase (NAD+)
MKEVAMANTDVFGIVERQREYYRSGITRDLEHRRRMLKKIRNLISREQGFILDALKKDMNKPALEAYASEIAITLGEIRLALRKLDSWSRPRRVKTALPLLPSLCCTVPEPLGVVLVMAPWNYPFMLAMVPLVSAIAAGNCVLVKPSEVSSHTAKAIEDLITRNIDPGYISVVTGGPDVARELLDVRFDHIFFTGGHRVARYVMEAASRNLTPVTLELGGKSPCIVDKDVSIPYAARRIAWAKYFNAGQTCVAPDYLLVDREIRDEFVDCLKSTITRFYGKDPRESPYYARIISKAHFDRLHAYLEQGAIVTGGHALAQELYIAPTVMDNVSPDSPLMQEEIFGPILPVLAFDRLPEALDFVNSRPKPLALYLFTRDKGKQGQVGRATSSGSFVINDATVQFATPYLPFGGVGESGMGSYHGKAGFDTFSHTRGVVKNTLLFDIPLRYVPYRFKLPLVKWLF